MIETRDHRLWNYELDANPLENRSMWYRSNARHVLPTDVSPVSRRPLADNRTLLEALGAQRTCDSQVKLSPSCELGVGAGVGVSEDGVGHVDGLEGPCLENL